MTLALATSGVVYNLAILAPAAFFAVVTYILWAHGTGRLAERIYRRVERRAKMGPDRGAHQRRSAGGPRRAQQAQSVGTDRRAHTRDPGRQTGRARATRGRVGRDGPRISDRRHQQSHGRRRSQHSAIARQTARAILGVESGADQPTVKRAYRERVKDVHPDTDGGDVEHFKRVQAAYDILSE